jgi:tRNA (guanine-N7-)-methyltransferase
LRRAHRLSLEELAPYLLPLPDPPAPFDWPLIFGNYQPVEIEIGFGKGLFLLTTALAHPEVNYVGVEIVRKYQLFTANRIAKRSLSNVRLACADARTFLCDCVGTASCQALHVYFPDPWWKRRHERRRVWTPEFASNCSRVLAPGGGLYLATDVEAYFATMCELLDQQAQLRRLEGTGALDSSTNFERKAQIAGKNIYRRVYRRSDEQFRDRSEWPPI